MILLRARCKNQQSLECRSRGPAGLEDQALFARLGHEVRHVFGGYNALVRDAVGGDARGHAAQVGPSPVAEGLAQPRGVLAVGGEAGL